VPRRWYVLASEVDFALIGSHLVDEHFGVPPAGYAASVHGSWTVPGAPFWPLARSLRLPVCVEYDYPDTGPHGWWWGPAGDLLPHLGQHAAEVLQRALGLIEQSAGLVAGSLLAWPVILKGTGSDDMRWLQTTHRGLLFGEAFQHKLDWGKPGDDPTTSEGDALTLADLLAGQWSTIMATSLLTAFSPDVVYTEVGVVELNQSDPGGDVTESYGTQWSMYPTGSRPTGGSATTSLPYEVACAVSTQTDHRGPSGKGRFYLPPFSKDAITNHGLYNMGVVSPVIVAIGNFIDSIKGSEDLVPIVVSRKHRILNEIKSINVGIVPDSQRRRRRSLSEARVPEWTA
jgi:hypothetical protein